jgi:CUG-BP- and ETR3-like factor
VTFESHEEALNAVEALHDKVKLPTSTNFLQIRPADYPSEKEHKIFVGMLGKNIAEPDLERMFGPYGELKEVRLYTIYY